MKKFLFFLLFLFAFKSFAQSNIDVGLLPKIVLAKKLNNKFKWVNSLETRQFVYKEKLQFTHSLVDVSSILSYKTDLNQSFNFGYILRFREGEIIHRLVQHYNYVHNFDASKLAHRLGFEQFFSSEKPQYRTRYRITYQKPLNGEKVDVKEWYVKISNEYLYQFNKENFEARLSPYLGYQLNPKNKIELGLDYRLGKILDDLQTNNLWLRATLYLVID